MRTKCSRAPSLSLSRSLALSVSFSPLSPSPCEYLLALPPWQLEVIAQEGLNKSNYPLFPEMVIWLIFDLQGHTHNHVCHVFVQLLRNAVVLSFSNKECLFSLSNIQYIQVCIFCLALLCSADAYFYLGLKTIARQTLIFQSSFLNTERKCRFDQLGY